jgi:hypothetical protein
MQGVAAQGDIFLPKFSIVYINRLKIGVACVLCFLSCLIAKPFW